MSANAGTSVPYGQKSPMEDPTMVGTLQAQIEMIAPFERPLLERRGIRDARRLLDLACGTGRFLLDITRHVPHLEATGVDLFPGHLAIARRDLDAAGRADVVLIAGDACATGLPAGSFDAVTIRHVLQAVPHPPAFLAEARRVLRPGGFVHALVEDYQGLLFDARTATAERLYLDAAPRLLDAGSDLLHGRRAFREMRAAGFVDVRVDPIVIDTSNSSRATFARMLRFWRDGYVDFLSNRLGEPPAVTRARFDDQIAAVEDPDRYVGWWLLAVSGRAPA